MFLQIKPSMTDRNKRGLKVNKAYLCHEFGGKQENVERTTEIANYMHAKFNSDDDLNTLIMSPIHIFGWAYFLTNYHVGINMCLEVLKDCDEMWTFGSESESRGCIIEKQYCEDHGIPIINWDLDDVPLTKQ